MRLIGIIISFVLITGLTYGVSAQDKNPDKKIKEEKKGPYLFWGGSLWLGFGSYTYVDVNAVFGSQLTERISVGISGKYQYYKDNDRNTVTGDFQTFETNVYGGSVFSQIAIIKDFRNLFKVKAHNGIVAHMEYEFLNTDYNYLHFNDLNTNRDRYWLHNVLIGGGYFQKLGKKAGSYIILLWNVNQTSDNPYDYPQIRIGFSVGI